MLAQSRNSKTDIIDKKKKRKCNIKKKTKTNSQLVLEYYNLEKTVQLMWYLIRWGIVKIFWYLIKYGALKLADRWNSTTFKVSKNERNSNSQLVLDVRLDLSIDTLKSAKNRYHTTDRNK